MAETMTGAELFGTGTKTAAELFGPEQLDPNKITGADIPNGDKILDRKPSYKNIYEDILTGKQNWDEFIPAEKRAVLRETMPDYENGGKRLINSAYLSDLTGTDIESAYITHDQLADTLLQSKTPAKAFDRIKNRFNNGRIQTQIMDLGYQALTGKLDPAVALERITKLRGQLTADYKEDLRV
jgi:hypothetical protein